MASQVPVGPPPEGIKEGVDFSTFFQRGLDKCKQQPLVPIGMRYDGIVSGMHH